MEDSVTKQSVTRHYGQRMIRSFGIGFGAAALALACGADDSNNKEEPTKPVDIQRPDPCANPLNAECPSNQAANNIDTSTSAGNNNGAGATKEPPSQAELDKAAAENVLKADCGYCHGPALTQRMHSASPGWKVSVGADGTWNSTVDVGCSMAARAVAQAGVDK